MTHDVLIIGAGPAGGAAALRLASAGIKLAVLEKERLPRRKPCRGALTPEAADLLERGMEAVIDRQIFSVRTLFAWKQERIFKSAAHPILYLVERTRFDYQLLQLALMRGTGNVEVKDNFLVRRVEEHRHGVTVVGKGGDRLTAKYIIAGDGVFSPTARRLGLKPSSAFGWAIDTDVEPAGALFEEDAHRATFNFECIPGGYGWIFPKQDYFSCGLCIWRSPVRLADHMEDFLKRSFPAADFRVTNRSIHPIPMFTGIGHIATGRVCLAGDAAGLADPITGEGIRYALESGVLAADAVLESLSETRGKSGNLTATYVPSIRDGIGKHLDAIRRFAVPVYRKSPEFFYRKFFLTGGTYGTAFRNLARRMAGQSDGASSARPL